MVTIMGLCGGDGVEKITGLGQRLRQLMEERKLNYEELGQRVDMRPQTLNRYVLGQREPKGQVVAELAMKLGVDPLWLQGYDVPRQRESESEKAGQVPVYSLLSGANPFDAQPPEGYAPADLPSGEGYVYLRVTESGMEDAGILPGDQVLIRRQASVRSGQIALVAFAQPSGCPALVLPAGGMGHPPACQSGTAAGAGGSGAVLQRQRPGAGGGCGVDEAVLREERNRGQAAQRDLSFFASFSSRRK